MSHVTCLQSEQQKKLARSCLVIVERRLKQLQLVQSCSVIVICTRTENATGIKNLLLANVFLKDY